ncbi:hypothetical protein LLG95_12455 [bacterium]|nr:hypothetical protein [bacterium]
MSEPVDTAALKRLESEALSYEKQNDYVSALDVYEEIDRKGWSQPQHLLALGECYMRARQRQNAREAWLRAWEGDSSLTQVVANLDRFFPGWEKTVARRQHEDAPPPPPDFDQSGAELTVESVSYRTPPPAAPAVPPPEPPPRMQPRLSPSEATMLSPQAPIPPAAPAPPVAPQRPVAPMAPPQQLRIQPTQVVIEAAKVVLGGEMRESKVNWGYIMTDSAEEAAKQRPRNKPHGGTHATNF